MAEGLTTADPAVAAALPPTLDGVFADRVSGASEIESRLLAALAALPEAELGDAVRTLAGRIESTFPQMANLKTLAQEMSALLNGNGGAGGIDRGPLLDFVARREADRERRERRLSSAVIPLLPEGDLLIFTLSKSGTVTSVLLDLLAAGRRLNVLVAESRPGGEGGRFARALAEHGVRCRTCDDFLLLSLVPKEAAARRPPGYDGSPIVLVGADAVHPDALVNKVGTRALLETARMAGVPAFVLASSTKIRAEAAPRNLGSLFEAIPRNGFVVVSERGVEPAPAAGEKAAGAAA